MAEQQKPKNDHKSINRHFLLKCWLIIGLIAAFLKLLYATFYLSESWSHQKTYYQFYYKHYFSNPLSSLQELIPLKNLGLCLLGLAYIPIFIHHIHSGVTPIYFLHSIVVYFSLVPLLEATFDHKSIPSLISALWAIWIISYFVWAVPELCRILERLKTRLNTSGNRVNSKSGEKKAETPTENRKEIAEKDVGKGDAQVEQIYPVVEVYK